MLVSVVADGGLGGGSLGVPPAGMAGGFAISGRGPRWARVAVAPVALVGWPLFAPLIDPGLVVTTPRGAWVAVLFGSSLAVLVACCSIPHRAVAVSRPGPPAAA
ncbi:hypothetical protein [Pseudonocardia abyssalis]|uniref:Uncharacterized protein n=1 Tax=Pseudonocardia abyssalis TaxID=2792008 RepID=A0ABS6UXU9_9PSEU|nr:hypothetical protein [Pseudonocardia abyssalis]MBW0114856.1 hypothetical protein [Pseudonocardia abyssalis]MBW0137046.1 hypothetical protein [Pseudonocardia abyssalis]